MWQGRGRTTTVPGKKKPKTNFVEVRTYLHLYRSFDRMWIFFILALQVTLILGLAVLLFMLPLPENTCIWLRLGILPCKFSFIYDNNFLQAMIIISWSNLGLVGVLTDEDVFKNVSSIFITYAILNFFQGTKLLYIFAFFCIY